MKYYSEKTKKIYKTIEELEKAEKEVVEEELRKEKLKETKNARKQELIDAWNTFVDDTDKLYKELADKQRIAKDLYVKTEENAHKEFDKQFNDCKVKYETLLEAYVKEFGTQDIPLLWFVF